MEFSCSNGKENAEIDQIDSLLHRAIASQPDDCAVEPVKKEYDAYGTNIYASQDLFSDASQSTVGTEESKRSYTERQLKEFSWVQCDNIDCQKWRKISTEVANRLGDDQWFCYMNTDPMFDSCDALEEDYTTYDRMAKKLGLKFIMSKLAEGSLVWAKMVGYCRWPAVVTKDPVSGYFFEVDYHGDPTVYHVEYLGRHHTHAWVRADRISLYGHRADTTEDSLKKKKTCKGRRKPLCMTNKNKSERKRYKRMAVDEAITEADLFLVLSEEDRLSKCQFKYAVKKPFPVEEKDELKELIPKPSKKIGTEKTISRKNLQNSAAKKPRNLTSNKQNITAQKKKFIANSDQICHHCGQHNENIYDFNAETTADENICGAGLAVKQEPLDSGLGKSLDLPVSSTSASESSQKLQSASLEFNSTLINKSKEEKFKIDLQMYKRNEKAFDHDLRRFMDRNKMKLKRTPIWHNVPVSLFQLFLAVHERGGFLEVCCKRLWSAVYKELTETHHTSSGQAAKNFYERNLYPYELYLSGKSFQHAVEKFGQKKDRKRLKSETNIKLDVVPRSPSAESEETDDLEAMLDELEDYSNLCQIEDELDSGDKIGSEMKLSHGGRKFGIDVKFHDDSTPEGNFSPGVKIADTASEFGKAKSPGSSTHCVPYVMFSSSSGSSRDVQILHEMQALEQNLAALDQDDELSL